MALVEQASARMQDLLARSFATRVQACEAEADLRCLRFRSPWLLLWLLEFESERQATALVPQSP